MEVTASMMKSINAGSSIRQLAAALDEFRVRARIRPGKKAKAMVEQQASE